MIEIGGVPIKRLLDSGANVSMLGSGCESFLENKKLKFHNMPCTVKTAKG